MIQNIFTRCKRCNKTGRILYAETITVNETGVLTVHSKYFSVMYNGAELEQSDGESFIIIPECILCG